MCTYFVPMQYGILWNLQIFEIWNLKISIQLFLKTNFSNRSKNKWPAGDGDTFIFRVLSGQSNWGRSFSKIHQNLTEIPVWSDFARIGFWKCVTPAIFSFGRSIHLPRDQWLLTHLKLSKDKLQDQWWRLERRATTLFRSAKIQIFSKIPKSALRGHLKIKYS